MDLIPECCGRCGTAVYDFSRKEAASDSSHYCVKCAEELDREYLAKNICSLCTKLIAKKDVKFVMPSRLYSNYFFDRLPIENRLMCASCYRKVDKLHMIRKPFIKLGHLRARIRKSMIKDSAIKLNVADHTQKWP